MNNFNECETTIIECASLFELEYHSVDDWDSPRNWFKHILFPSNHGRIGPKAFAYCYILVLRLILHNLRKLSPAHVVKTVVALTRVNSLNCSLTVTELLVAVLADFINNSNFKCANN